MIIDYQQRLTIADIENAINGLKMPELPKIEPSGTSSFVIECGPYKITLIKNEMMPPDGFAILSPDLYERVVAHLINAASNNIGIK